MDTVSGSQLCQNGLMPKNTLEVTGLFEQLISDIIAHLHIGRSLTIKVAITPAADYILNFYASTIQRMLPLSVRSSVDPPVSSASGFTNLRLRFSGFFYVIFFFLEKTRLDVSCESSA